MKLCRICGAPLRRTIEYTDRCTCEYCGEINEIHKQEPFENTGKDLRDLLKQASDMRENYKFCEAQELYDAVLADEPENPEAIWGRLCCKYGVVYVEDETEQGMLTCHKLVDSDILEDDDYRRLKVTHWIYRHKNLKEDVDKISEIQKEIKALQANKETIYDIFLCYKQSEINSAFAEHKSTVDSYDAEYLYYLLKKEGYRVFFAKETLKNMAGVKYEAAIFHAISTAKVMLVFGSRPEYLESTWVKSEWQRYIAYARECPEQKTVLPIVKTMNVAGLPTELRGYQAISFDKDEKRNFSDLRWRLRELTGSDEKHWEKQDLQEIVAQLDDNTKKALLMLAEKEGDIRQIDYFQDEIAMDVLDKSAHGYVAYLLGCICYEQGNNRKAVQYLERAGEQGILEAKEQLAFMRGNCVI